MLELCTWRFSPGATSEAAAQHILQIFGPTEFACQLRGSTWWIVIPCAVHGMLFVYSESVSPSEATHVFPNVACSWQISNSGFVHAQLIKMFRLFNHTVHLGTFLDVLCVVISCWNTIVLTRRTMCVNQQNLIIIWHMFGICGFFLIQRIQFKVDLFLWWPVWHLCLVWREIKRLMWRGKSGRMCCTAEAD